MISVQSIRPSATNAWQFYSIMFFGIFIGSWAAILGRFAQAEGISTPVIVASRMGLGTLVLTPIVLRYYLPQLRQMTWRDWVLASFGGFWITGALLGMFYSLEHTTVLITNIIGSTGPIWVALMEKFILRTRLNRMVYIGLVITLVGGISITLAAQNTASIGHNPLLGGGLALASAVMGSIYTIVGRSARDKVPLVPYFGL
jgi:drug/metabolite transporter (DMT)-like permease